MGKYNLLEDYFKSKVTLELTYEEIENIMKSELPASAYTDRTWWGNTQHPSRSQAHSWLNGGWKVHQVQLGKSITFIRNNS